MGFVVESLQKIEVDDAALMNAKESTGENSFVDTQIARRQKFRPIGKREYRIIAFSVQTRNILDGKWQVVFEVEMRER